MTPTTDTSERGLRRLIYATLTGGPCDPCTIPPNAAQKRPSAYGVGWTGGIPEHYDREDCVDLAQLWAAPRDAAGIVPALALDEVRFCTYLKGKSS